MSILAGVTTGASRTGIRIVVAGQEKMGKTTFAAFAPNPLLVPLEVGFAGVICPKTQMIQNLEQFRELLAELIVLMQRGQLPFRSLIVDSSTALEQLIHDFVLRLDPAYKPGATKTITMESAHGGYGKAYTLSNTIMGDILKQLDILAVYGNMNIIITCHVFSSKVSDPNVGEYDSWELLLHSPKNNKTYGKREMVTQWADVIGLIYEPIFLLQSDKGASSRGVSQNKGRVMALSRTPSYTAGNRFGIIGEIPLPVPPNNSWNSFAHALYNAAGIDIFTR